MESILKDCQDQTEVGAYHVSWVQSSKVYSFNHLKQLSFTRSFAFWKFVGHTVYGQTELTFLLE